jgi:hypothetical protein
MTYFDYLSYIEDAKQYAATDMFIAAFGYPADCPYTPEELTDTLTVIWDVAHEDIAALFFGKNLSALSRKYNIPLRTLQDWQCGKRTPPLYILQLLGFAMICKISS